jgi:hypothetical protein
VPSSTVGVPVWYTGTRGITPIVALKDETVSQLFFACNVS